MNNKKSHSKSSTEDLIISSTFNSISEHSINTEDVNKEKKISLAKKMMHKKSSANEPQEVMIGPSYMTDNTQNHNMSEPIIGYADEPLLPLRQACQPLENILHNLWYYVEIALAETPESPANGLTIDESAAIRLYTIEWKKPHRSLYSELNHTLKWSPRSELRPYFRYMKLFLTALAKIPCLPMLTVWRGITKDLTNEYTQGSWITWWSFSSCTSELTVLENQIYLGKSGKRTLFSLEAINARAIRDHSHFATEDEVLLLPGTLMESQSLFSPAPDLHVVHLKQIKPTEPLLEEPFEGAKLYAPELKFVPWYKRKLTYAEIAAFLILCCGAITLGVVLSQRSETPRITCTSGQANIEATYYWSFDCGSFDSDFGNKVGGTGIHGADFSDSDFSGKGRALKLDGTRDQYVRLNKTLGLFSNISFTVSAWLTPHSFSNQAILSECHPTRPVCVALTTNVPSINYVIYSSIDRHVIKKLSGSVTNFLCYACWLYATFVYDHDNQQVEIYINGVSIVQGSSEFEYPNTTNSTHVTTWTCIGCNSLVFGQPFHGLIDQLSIWHYKKTSNQILREATTLAHYKFNTDDIDLDSGPNSIRATSLNVFRLIKNNQSTLLFNTSISFFQVKDFTLLDSNNMEFTISFWIRPRFPSVYSSTTALGVLQFTVLSSLPLTKNYNCLFHLHIYPQSGSLGFFLLKTFQEVIFNHSKIEDNDWVHIGISFQSPQTFLFYQNGELAGNISNLRISTLIPSYPRLSVVFGSAVWNLSMSNLPPYYEQSKCFACCLPLDFRNLDGEIEDVIIFARRLIASEFVEIVKNTKPSN